MTTTPARARLASVDDAEAVAGLLHAFNVEFGEPSPGVEVLAARLRLLLASPGSFAVLAGDPPCAIGLVTLRTNVWTDGAVALLDELYTAPDRRGRGVGAAVLELVVTEAARRGATELEIEVDEPDVDAQRFYERHGFPMRDPGTGDRAFVLRRALDA